MTKLKNDPNVAALELKVDQSTPVEAPSRGRTAVRLKARPGVASKEVDSDGAKRAPRQRRRPEEARELILRAALECFGAFGFEGTSTRAVAERAKVTHTLVLYYFDSKDRLWTSAIEYVLKAYSEEISILFSNVTQENAQSTLLSFIEKFVRLSAQYPQVHRILTMEGNSTSERMYWVIEKFIRNMFDNVTKIIKLGQESGKIRKCDPARLYYYIIAAGGTPFTISTEYSSMTGRNIFSEPEILRTIAFIYEFTLP